MISTALPPYFFNLVLLLFADAADPASAVDKGVSSAEIFSVQDNQSPRFSWENVKSVEEALTAYPERIRYLVASLDLDLPGLARMKASLEKGDTATACKALLDHYRKSAPAHWLQPERVADVDKKELLHNARQISHDSVIIHGVTAEVPREDGGGWDWGFTGPDDDQEFGYSLNGHQYLVTLFEAWKLTGDDTHIKTFDRIIKDWIINNPVPLESDSVYIVLKSQGKVLDYRDIGEVRWRTLEAGNRLGVSWPHLFLAFQESEAFTPAARLLLLSGIAEHAEFLKEYHKNGHNWTTMEMNGLALAGLSFPEFKNAESWATYALDVMKTEIFRQVYPDGVQKELSTKTQWVALGRFESVASHFRQAGREIPGNYIDRLEEMYNYLAYAMRPDGHQPLNNDSDREDLRPRVLDAAKVFDRPDWTWIATNGENGTQPKGLPSVVFPWAGIHVMRNGWDADAHWTFFDTGPFGTGHQHADMLHLSISAYGRDLLVDGGRYTHEDYFSFDPTIWRGYFRSSFSHNVILVDGKGQKGGPLTIDQPLVEGVDFLNTTAFDYARGTFSAGFNDVEGKVEHSRAVLYVRDRFWIVVDEIATDRPRRVDVLWHYAPSCTVRMKAGTTLSVDEGEGNLQVMPLGKRDLQLKLIRGETQPVIQGWYSETYGSKTPNTTAVFSTEVADREILAWLLIPLKDKFSKISAQLEKTEDGALILISEEGKETMEVTVPVRGGLPEIR